MEKKERSTGLPNVCLLALATATLAAQSILKKSYTVRLGKRGAFLFLAVSVLAAALFFLAAGGFSLHLTRSILPYALGFALSYGTAVTASLASIRLGSLSLTSLITSYSLLIPTLYGLFFLGEEVSLPFLFGLALLLISLFLVNGKKGTRGRITLPWMVAVSLAFLGNGICSTVQTAQQKAFFGAYKSETMLFALLLVFFAMLALSLFYERGDITYSLRRGGWYAGLCGVLNGACNFLVMLLSVRMPASLMFPVISAGGILLTCLVSRFLYRERLSGRQYLAILLGAASVALMSL